MVPDRVVIHAFRVTLIAGFAIASAVAVGAACVHSDRTDRAPALREVVQRRAVDALFLVYSSIDPHRLYNVYERSATRGPEPDLRVLCGVWDDGFAVISADAMYGGGEICGVQLSREAPQRILDDVIAGGDFELAMSGSWDPRSSCLHVCLLREPFELRQVVRECRNTVLSESVPDFSSVDLQFLTHVPTEDVTLQMAAWDKASRRAWARIDAAISEIRSKLGSSESLVDVIVDCRGLR